LLARLLFFLPLPRGVIPQGAAMREKSSQNKLGRPFPFFFFFFFFFFSADHMARRHGCVALLFFSSSISAGREKFQQSCSAIDLFPPFPPDALARAFTESREVIMNPLFLPSPFLSRPLQGNDQQRPHAAFSPFLPAARVAGDTMSHVSTSDFTRLLHPSPPHPGPSALEEAIR